MRTRIASGSTRPDPTERALRAVDESHLLSMHVALTTHGVRHTVQRPDGEGLAKYSHCITVQAADFDRAAAIVGELQVTTPQLAPSDNARFRLFVAVVTLLMIAAVLYVWFGPHS